MRSKKYADKLIKFLDLKKNGTVIEVGPGDGMVTKEILKAGNNVIAVEIDYDLIVRLIKRFGKDPGFTVVNEDFLNIDLALFLAAHTDDTEIKVTGSLPYNVSKKIINKVIRFNFDNPGFKSKLTKASFIVQEEVARNYTAKSPKATFLSNYISLFSYTKKAETVRSIHFTPRPKVNGAILNIEMKKNYLSGTEKIAKFIKISFASPRKTLKNNLVYSRNWDSNQVSVALKKTSLPESVRPAEMTMDQWEKLFKIING